MVQDSSDTSSGNVELTTHLNPGSTPTRVRLPKLELKRFNGELTAWTPFWDSFGLAVHNSTELSAVDKFNYLRSLLEPAAAAIAGLTNNMTFIWNIIQNYEKLRVRHFTISVSLTWTSDKVSQVLLIVGV